MAADELDHGKAVHKGKPPCPFPVGVDAQGHQRHVHDKLFLKPVDHSLNYVEEGWIGSVIGSILHSLNNGLIHHVGQRCGGLKLLPPGLLECSWGQGSRQVTHH